MSEKYRLLSDIRSRLMDSVANKIARRIRAKKRGWVFTPKDFSDLGTRATIDQTLSRLARQGTIRRIGRGYYDYPKKSPILGVLSPDSDLLAKAITAKSGNQVFPSGAMAANMLGLTTQVPAKPTYLTNGPSQVKQIGNRTVTLKHARIPLRDSLTHKANFTLQALYYLGKDNIDELIIRRCASHLDIQDIKGLINMAAQLPGWMADIILKIQQAKHGLICKQG